MTMNEIEIENVSTVNTGCRPKTALDVKKGMSETIESRTEVVEQINLNRNTGMFNQDEEPRSNKVNEMAKLVTPDLILISAWEMY